MQEKKVIEYHDELNDEFSPAQITAKKIDKNYVYIHKSFIKKFTHFFWYRIVAFPLAKVYLFFKFHHKILNKKVLKPFKKQGYFMYANHTQPTADALIPTMVALPKQVYVIVHPNNVSIPFLGKVTPSLGALPLPDDMDATKNFVKAIEQRVLEKKVIMIYPEAHIWPYYTKIRNFVDTSFRYPIKYDTPTFCFTNTYQYRKHSKKVKLVTYVDGPFFPNKDLSVKDQRKDLRDQVYNKMVERSKKSVNETIIYKKGSDAND